ncbi:MAG: hypothetical protein GX339_05205 [Tissierellia bacterium]|nr:hypothetical protein [Tissierellia bacterium]
MADNVFAIYDVVDFAVQDYVSGDLLFVVDYAKSITLKTEAETLEIHGGIGNPVRITTNHSRKAAFESVLPLIDVAALGTKLGRKVTRGKQVASKTELLSVDAATGIAELSHNPEVGTLKVYAVADNGRDLQNELKLGDPEDDTGEYSISAERITVNEELKGKHIRVIYRYKTEDDTPLVRVTSEDFSEVCTITGEGYREDESGNKNPVSFICYRAKPTPEFEITFESGTATEVPFNCDLSVDIVNGESVYFDIIPIIGETWRGGEVSSE